MSIPQSLDGLGPACLVWETSGDFGPLARWLGRELTSEGCPRRLPVEDWGPCLDRLHGSEDRRPGWPEPSRTQVSGWFARLVHSSRPDGSHVFGARGTSRARTARLQDGAARATDQTLASVVGRWFPGSTPSRTSGDLPLPARSETDRVFATLRPDWLGDGDWIAIDQRDPAVPARIELAGGGVPWLSGAWPAGPLAGAAQPTSWTTGAYADCLEWSFRSGRTRITRTAVLLRYRKMALIAQQEDGPASEGLRLAIAEKTTATPVEGQRALALTRGRAKARLVPLGLPALPYETDKGSIKAEGTEVVVNQRDEGRRRWLPMLVSWGKPPVQWRVCTVTEKSEKCRADVAFGARVSWGLGDDGLLIYRSLGPSALRVVLGHQTRARFLIGRFTPEGNVVPLVTLE